MKSTPMIYRHYKNKLYKYLGIARHSETLEEMVVYKPLYKNTMSELWIRPKSMFDETINFNGNDIPRFKPVQFKYQSLKDPNEIIKHDLLKLTHSIFLDLTKNKFDKKLVDKKNIYLHVAHDETKLIGFKLGYEINKTTFYSWLGAVDFEYRGFGIAQELMSQQHQWCKDQGYKYIETKTLNRWKGMLLLNIKNGFEIIGTESNDDIELKIQMLKTLV